MPLYKRSFRAPVKTPVAPIIEKSTEIVLTETKPKLEKGLTDSQYEKIFEAVLQPDSKSSALAQSSESPALVQSSESPESPALAQSPREHASQPTEQASLENSQHNQQKQKPVPSLREAIRIVNEHKQFSGDDSYSSPWLTSQDVPLSQPPKGIRHRQRLLWLQMRRGVGLWVMCSRPSCSKWRYLDDVKDPVDVPKEWFCSMNSDIRYNSCAAPERGPTPYQEEDMVHNLYTAGSVVWARLAGYPWWPALVDDCPDTEQYYWLNGFSDIPTHYNVTFLDEKEVSRAWLPASCLMPYKNSTNPNRRSKKSPEHLRRLAAAKSQADDALRLEILDRLRKYSFLTRWPKEIVTPPSTDSDTGSEHSRKRNKLINKLIEDKTDDEEFDADYSDADVPRIKSRKSKPKSRKRKGTANNKHSPKIVASVNRRKFNDDNLMDGHEVDKPRKINDETKVKADNNNKDDGSSEEFNELSSDSDNSESGDESGNHDKPNHNAKTAKIHNETNKEETTNNSKIKVEITDKSNYSEIKSNKGKDKGKANTENNEVCDGYECNETELVTKPETKKGLDNKLDYKSDSQTRLGKKNSGKTKQCTNPTKTGNKNIDDAKSKSKQKGNKSKDNNKSNKENFENCVSGQTVQVKRQRKKSKPNNNRTANIDSDKENTDPRRANMKNYKRNAPSSDTDKTCELFSEDDEQVEIKNISKKQRKDKFDDAKDIENGLAVDKAKKINSENAKKIKDKLESSKNSTDEFYDGTSGEDGNVHVNKPKKYTKKKSQAKTDLSSDDEGENVTLPSKQTRKQDKSTKLSKFADSQSDNDLEVADAKFKALIDKSKNNMTDGENTQLIAQKSNDAIFDEMIQRLNDGFDTSGDTPSSRTDVPQRCLNDSDIIESDSDPSMKTKRKTKSVKDRKLLAQPSKLTQSTASMESKSEDTTDFKVPKRSKQKQPKSKVPTGDSSPKSKKIKSENLSSSEVDSNTTTHSKNSGTKSPTKPTSSEPSPSNKATKKPKRQVPDGNSSAGSAMPKKKSKPATKKAGKKEKVLSNTPQQPSESTENSSMAVNTSTMDQQDSLSTDIIPQTDETEMDSKSDILDLLPNIKVDEVMLDDVFDADTQMLPDDVVRRDDSYETTSGINNSVMNDILDGIVKTSQESLPFDLE